MIDFTLKDLDGNSVTLSSFKGKNILLIFWDTSCPYCNTQLGLIPYIRSRDSNLIILAVNKGEDADYVKKVSARRNYEVTILIDPEKKVTNLYPTRYSPTNLLINKDGMVNYNVSPTGIQTEKQADEFLQMIK
jgi:peroxiredoxin